jgi:hypothetical protein
MVEYPKRLQGNSTVERMLLEGHQVTVSSSVLGAAGGWGVGLLMLVIALGVAIVYWAHRKGRWRPGMVYGRVMGRLRPRADA